MSPIHGTTTPGAIAAKVVGQGAGYVLALKADQPSLHDDIRRFLNDKQRTPDPTHRTIDADHGRIETRASSVCTDIEWLQELHAWPGLAAVDPPATRPVSNFSEETL